MADGNVTIGVDIDDTQAARQLAALNKRIQKLEADISKGQQARLPLTEQLREADAQVDATARKLEELKAALAASELKTSVDSPGRGNGSAMAINVDEFVQELENQKQIKQEIAETEKLLEQQTAAAAKLDEQDQKRAATLQQQTEELKAQQVAAGELTAQISQTSSSGNSSSGFVGWAKGLKNLQKEFSRTAKKALLLGVGVRSMMVLFRKLRSYIISAVKAYAEADPETSANINELKNSLSQLKASWGAAFAPVLNAVMPILKTLISWLQAAADAIAMFFAALSGKSTYKKAISNADALASSVGGAGAAAEDAKKELMSIDELNVMSDNSSSGGGGGGSGSDYSYEDVAINEEIVEKMKDILWYAGAIAAALAGWTIAKAFGLGLKQCLGLAMALGGAVLYVKGGLDAWQNGFDWQNLLEMLGGAALIIGGLALAFGSVAAGIAAIVTGVGLVVVALHEWVTTGELSTQACIALCAGLMLIGGGIALLTGSWIPLVVAAVLALVAVVVKNWDKIKAKCSELWEKVKETFNNIKTNIVETATEAWNKLTEIWENLKTTVTTKATELWTNIKNKFESIRSTIVDKVNNGVNTAVTAFNNLKEKVRSIIESIKSYFNFNWQLPQLRLPHIQVQWQDAGALAKFFGISAIPHLSVAWYAKGGIVDGATLIGAGEAGKEAIVPLERNTEWIGMVAKGIADILFGGGELSTLAEQIANIPTAIDRMTSTLSNFALPAVASGYVVPPNATGGGFLTDELAEKLSNFLDQFGTSDATPVNITTKVMIDRKEIGEAVYGYINDRNRGRGA